MEALSIGGLACAIQRNEQSDRLLVLVHGGMDRMSSMRKLTRRAVPESNVLSYDRRGYGASLEAGDEPLIKDHIEDLTKILLHAWSELGFRASNTYMFGHSMGGVISIGASIALPLAGVAVFESPIAWMEVAQRTAVGDAMVEKFTDPEEYAENFMRRMVGDKIWERMTAATRAARRAEGSTLLAEMRDVRATTPWLPSQIQLPLRIGYGNQSFPHQIGNAKILAGLVPGSDLIEFPSIGHAAHLQAPTEVYEQLIRPLWL